MTKRELNSGGVGESVDASRLIVSLHLAVLVLSLVAVAPWEVQIASIWTQPKVTMLAMVLLTNLLFILLALRRKVALTVGRRFTVMALLLGLLLVTTAVGAALTPYPERALLGDARYGTSWQHLLMISMLVLSNTLVVAIYPSLARLQLRALLVAGAIAAAALFPQVLDWRIDYTAASGEVLPASQNILVSGIWSGQMPISVYSHRGRAGAVLALTATLALVLALRARTKAPLEWSTFVLASVAVWFVDTRGPWLAYLGGVAVAIVLATPADRRLAQAGRTLLLVVLCALPYIGARLADLDTLRNLPDPDAGINRVTSGRVGFWQLTWARFLDRPVLGWGFDGFGVVSMLDRAETAAGPQARVELVGDYVARATVADGTDVYVIAASGKAHNILLDLLVSHGIVGTLLYLAAFLVAVAATWTSRFRPLLACVFAFWVFLATWFDAAQYAHLQWLVLSMGLASTVRVATGAPSDSGVDAA